jgi:hypothetical protein
MRNISAHRRRGRIYRACGCLGQMTMKHCNTVDDTHRRDKSGPYAGAR